VIENADLLYARSPIYCWKRATAGLVGVGSGQLPGHPVLQRWLIQIAPLGTAIATNHCISLVAALQSPETYAL